MVDNSGVFCSTDLCYWQFVHFWHSLWGVTFEASSSHAAWVGSTQTAVYMCSGKLL